MGCEEESLVEDIQVCFFFLLPLLAFHCTSTRSLWNSYSRDFTTCQQLWKKVGAENIWNYDLNKNVRLYEFSFIIPSLTSLTNKCKNPHGHGVCLPLRSPKDSSVLSLSPAQWTHQSPAPAPQNHSSCLFLYCSPVSRLPFVRLISSTKY